MHFGKAVLLILVSTRLNPLPKPRNCVMYSVCWTAAMNTELTGNVAIAALKESCCFEFRLTLFQPMTISSAVQLYI